MIRGRQTIRLANKLSRKWPAGRPAGRNRCLSGNVSIIWAGRSKWSQVSQLATFVTNLIAALRVRLAWMSGALTVGRSLTRRRRWRRRQWRPQVRKLQPAASKRSRPRQRHHQSLRVAAIILPIVASFIPLEWLARARARLSLSSAVGGHYDCYSRPLLAFKIGRAAL